MDELGPFLFLLIAGLIQLVNFLVERGKKKRAAEQQSTGQEEPAKPKSGLEQFFENLAQKLDPNQQQSDLPEWPDGYEKPDYAAEQAAYSEFQEQEEEKPTAEIIPMPEPVRVEVRPNEVELEGTQFASLKSAMKAMPALKSSFSSNMPSTPILKSNAAGSINFSLKNKAELRKAILAKVVLDPPRAYDESFKNTSL